MVRLRTAVGELRKPLALVKAEQKLREAMVARAEIDEKRKKRIIELHASPPAATDGDAYLDHLTRELQAAEKLVGERRRERAAARNAWQPKAHAQIEATGNQVRDTIGPILDALQAACQPYAEAADACRVGGITEAPLAQAVRQIFISSHAMRQALNSTAAPRKVSIRFVENVTTGDGRTYEAGEVCDLSELC